ncbi:hypothetical protein GQ457_04G007640 [Hibiscus cannabinus]
MCHIDSMSMLEVYDMVKELGYNSPQEIYWQSPGGVLSVNPLKTDSDVLSMLATMPRNKYAHVYLQEIVDELLPDSNAEIIRDAEISEHVETVRNEETVRNVKTELPIDAETVRNVETELPIDAETVRNTESEQSESEDEDTDYVGSESEQSASPFEDNDNDLVDDDLVCDVQVGVGRDIPGFRTCSSEDSDEGVNSEAETESLHSACDSETEVERNRFPEFNSVVDIENPKFKKGLLFSDQKIFKTALKQYAVKNKFNIRLKVNDSARVQAVCKDGCWPRNAGGQRWEVSAGFEDQHAVNLEAQTCTCRKWDLTYVYFVGIPCIHVASVILHIGARSEDFVNSCYRKETQLKIYSHMVKPLRGPKQWSHYQTDEPILPPVIRRPVGRPQTKRRNEPDEPVKATGRLAKLGVQMTCSKCGSKGHNKRSCRGQVGGNARAGKNARPSMSNTSQPMATAHASQSSTMPTARATTSKLSVSFVN